MAGRRIVDAAKLFHAAQSVAQKHIALRSSQWDAYSKTSTLAKAVKNQTDRVTLTAAAAIALSQRLGEEAPAYVRATAHRATGAQPDADKQETPGTETTANGTIPTAGLTLEQQENSFGESFQRPLHEPPRAPLAEDDDRALHTTGDGQPTSQIPAHAGTRKSSYEHRKHLRLNQDVPYTSSVKARQPQALENHVQPDEDAVPEGINTDVFHSRKVARMLGSDPFSRKEYTERKINGRHPLDDRPLPKQGGKHPLDDRPLLHANNVSSTLSNPDALSKSATQAVQETQSTPTTEEIKDLASQLAQGGVSNAEAASETSSTMNTSPEIAPYVLRESKVPSSRFGRLWQYAGLGTSMALGAVGEGLRRATGSAVSTSGSLMLSPGNLEILVAKLSRMRGAALKLGQMISFQDIKMLPPAIHDVLQRVQDSADYMPASQRNKVLAENLGENWRDLFESFEDIPIAAASIGQVHKAILKSTGQSVAVKIQYPGVANSIDSDLNNLSVLLTASRLLPKGLFLDKTIANARTELGWECDYTREAESQTRFRNLLQDDTSAFTVPEVFPEACGTTVLTAEFMSGVGVTKLKTLTQEQRDWIGTQILRLCLREIVEFKFMQTDPNWTNFLYNAKAQKIELLDFGASRDYPDEFVEPYIKILIAASKGDKSSIRDLSLELGYLTGDESASMLEAHVQSVLTLAEPFNSTGPNVYDFRDQTITDRVRGLIPVMVKERLAPPPEETYSLHRKLSGAFLLCAKLGSRVPCKQLFASAVETWEASKATR